MLLIRAQAGKGKGKSGGKGGNRSNGNGDHGKAVSRSSKAGLQFPVGRIHRSVALIFFLLLTFYGPQSCLPLMPPHSPQLAQDWQFRKENRCWCSRLVFFIVIVFHVS
jgi:hypothetical protein